MPEVPVYKHNYIVVREHEIWSPWQIASVCLRVEV